AVTIGVTSGNPQEKVGVPARPVISWRRYTTQVTRPSAPPITQHQKWNHHTASPRASTRIVEEADPRDTSPRETIAQAGMTTGVNFGDRYINHPMVMITVTAPAISNIARAPAANPWSSSNAAVSAVPMS